MLGCCRNWIPSWHADDFRDAEAVERQIRRVISFKFWLKNDDYLFFPRLGMNEMK